MCMTKRFAYAAIALVCAFAFWLLITPLTMPGLAQEAPTLPPADAPPTFTPDPGVATLPPPPDGAAPSGDVLSAQNAEALPILIAARTDLETLATDRLGADAPRPEGWSGVTDPAALDFAALLRADIDRLADAILGAGVRPPTYFGVVASVPLAVARDLRHDLEVLADAAIGASTLRPGGWIGDDPLFKCSRAAQNLLFVLERVYQFEANIDYTQTDYCTQLELQVSRYVESSLIQPQGGEAAAVNAQQAYFVESAYVIAFADINARVRLGVLPVGTGFTPVGRSTNDFSNMMLIQGPDFQVYTDFIYTPVTNDIFMALPTLDGTSATLSCAAEWCERAP